MSILVVKRICWKTVRAFTLTELLVVITVIVALIGLGVPSIHYALVYKDKVGCINNLRQIGIAMQGYANDHDMTLPGPARVQSYGFVRGSNYSDHLVHFLASYLNVVSKNGVTQYVDPFYCPACMRRAGGESAKAQLQCYITGQDPDIFGYPGTSKLPMRLTAIRYRSSGVSKNLSETVALQDANGSTNGLSSTAHETFRNVLYLDWHVESVPEPVSATP